MQSYSPNPRHHPACDSEAGYVLLAVIFLTFLLLLSLAIAAPKIAMSIQRDKDLETIHRGEQYKRALQLYYRQFGSYPTTIDQLVSTNNIRFLRKRYTDPETGKDDWKPVIYGQAHVRPLGFFGQPLSAIGGIATAAVVGGMGSGMYALAPATTTDAEGFPVSDNGSGTDTSSPGSGAASSSGIGSGSPTNGTGSGSFSMGGQSNSGFGSSPGSGFGSNSGPGPNGQSGVGTPGSGTPTSGFGSSTPGFGSSSNGSSGGTFGGSGPIVGFTLPVNKPSLVDYKLQSRYNKWEFNYDPMEDQMQQAAGLLGGGGGMSGTTGGMGTGTNGTQSGFGSNNGLGNSNGFGGSNNSGFGQPPSGTSGSGSSGSGSSGTGSSGSGSDNSGSSNPPTSPQ
ncbi:MAG: hypothetical protein WA294_08875 [Acidobacteriaceae bacterium]